MNLRKVYVQIEKYTPGSGLPASPKSYSIAYIGAMKRFQPNKFVFKNDGTECAKFVWMLEGKDIEDGVIRVNIFKQRHRSGDAEMGVIDLYLDAYPINKTTRKEYTLRTKNSGTPPKIVLKIHVCDNNEAPFTAPIGPILANFEFLPSNNNVRKTKLSGLPDGDEHPAEL